jgi:O-antigen/teichoic acid export membrane protein
MINKKLIIRNSLFLYLRVFIFICFSFYSVRLILDALGIVDYGIYSVLAGVIAMFAFLNNAMTSSTQRHLNFDIGKGDLNGVNITFNASLRIHIFLSLIILIVSETIGLYFINNVLKLPIDRMESAHWLFQCIIFILIFNIICIPYQAIINAKEDMHVIAIQGFFESFGKLLIAISLSYVAFDKLKYFGFMLLMLYILVNISFITYCVKSYKECYLSINKINKKTYNDLLSFASWTLFGALASVSRVQGLSIVLNMFFGPNINASFGVANQVSTQLSGVSTIFLRAVNPQMVKNFGSGNKTNMFKLSMYTSRFSYYILFIIALPFFFKMDFILGVWLKEVPEYASIFGKLMLVNFLLSIITGPLITIMQASGEIKIYQITISLIFLLNIPIAYLLLNYEYPPYYVIFSLIIITSIVNVIKLFFVKFKVKFDILNWLKVVLYRVLLTSLTSIIASVIFFELITIYASQINSFIIIGGLIIISILCAIVFGFTNNEKKNFNLLVRRLI